MAYHTISVLTVKILLFSLFCLNFAWKRALSDAEVNKHALDAYLSNYSDSASIASSHNTNAEMDTDDSDDENSGRQ